MSEKGARKVPERAAIEFVIADEKVNRKKWRMLLGGLSLENFEKNPVACVQHDTWRPSIGRWENLRVEGGELKGTLVFDTNDPEAVKLYWKYKDGYMSAVSLHILPLEESDAPELLLPGQVYPTITKSELLEVSVVTLPGNANAVKLLNLDGSEYQLNLITRKTMSKEDENNEQKPTAPNPEMEAMKLELEKQKKINAKNMVALHVQRGVVGEKEVDHLEKLAMQDYETTEAMLNAREVPGKRKEGHQPEAPKPNEGEQLAAQLEHFQQGKEKPQAERDGWTYLDWYKKDHAGLLAMQEKHPEKYKDLVDRWEAECKSKGLSID